MKLPLSAALLACALAFGTAQAQTSAQQNAPAGQAAAAQPSAPANASQDVDPNALVRGAVQMVGLVDLNRSGELWDSGSLAAKQASTRDAFVAQVSQSRQRLGMPVQRAWMTVRRQEVLANNANKIPPGVYATVEFATIFAQNKVVLEMVSLRLEADGRWHFTGYVIKQ